jgi:hypothetical protein
MNGKGNGAVPTLHGEATCSVDHTIGIAPNKRLVLIAVPANEEGAYG